MPENVGSIRNAVKYIKRVQVPKYTEEEVESLVQKINSKKQENTPQAKIHHIENLKRTHSEKV